MNERSLKFSRWLLSLGPLIFAVSLIAGPLLWYQDTRHAGQHNTKPNKDQNGPTADQQKMNPTDRALTQEIRKAIHRDRSLSNYAQNIRIMTQNGKIILRGPVRSEEEKGNLEAKAISAAGQENVTNQLEVIPSK
jgi:hyperosmotically inducible periplasmic protein